MSLFLLLLAACAAPKTAEVREVPADDVLVSVRAAIGNGADSIPAGVLVSGSCHEHGVDGSYEFLFGPRGRIKHSVASRLGELVAFDGETGWGRDTAGVVRRLSFGARVSTQGWLWVQNGHWLEPDGPFRITMLEDDSDASDSIRLRLVSKNDPWEATLFVNKESFLPERLLRRRAAGEREYRFSDWEEAMGFHYPNVVAITDVAGDISRFEATEVKQAPTFVRDPFTPVFHRPTDATFDESIPPELEARRMPSGHLIVHPTVNGRDVGWFILDSGASTICIDPEVADGLGLEAFGEVTIVGAGGATSGRFRSGAVLQVGPVQLPDLPWLELDLSFLESFFGVPVAGVVGYEFFARAVVSIDLVAGRVDVHDPEHFALEAGWQSLLHDDRIPCVQASFEGDHHDWFRLDTGSSDTVSFHSPTVERLGLLEGRETSGARHHGVGGAGEARRGKLEWFELAGERFEDVDVSFSTSEASALATPYTAGNLGSGLLGRFRLVFDYGGERIAFLPRPE